MMVVSLYIAALYIQQENMTHTVYQNITPILPTHFPTWHFSALAPDHFQAAIRVQVCVRDVMVGSLVLWSHVCSTALLHYAGVGVSLSSSVFCKCAAVCHFDLDQQRHHVITRKFQQSTKKKTRAGVLTVKAVSGK